MKAPRTSAADATTYLGRRSQPIRQIRINPPHNPAPDRAAGGRNGVGPANQPIEIFPGITHFTDAITALPKDLVRHFTLLREVDAKIYHPENALFRIVEELGNAPAPNCQSSQVVFPSAVSAAAATAASSSFSSSAEAPNSALATTLENSTGSQLLPNVHSRANDLVRSANNFPRRVIACQAITKIQDMLVSLEEKNHVISVANDRLQQQLGRMEETWPHLLKEFSDEAKWGSTTHWAYPENRLNRHAVAQGSRGRDGTHHITSAAQALAEEAAARSDARKQAVAAKKRNAHHQESDLDDHRTDHSKKSHGRSRKGGGEAPGNYGLGVTTPSSTANGSHPSKRRKVDKTSANGATTTAERNMASLLGSNAHKGKTNSPRETPAPEPGPPRKRKPLPTSSSNGQNKKKKNGGVSGSALSPSVTSSPGLTSLTEPKAATTASPAHTSAPKCTGARAKQGSVPANSEKSRPSPTASAKPDSSTPKSPFLDAAPTGSGSSKTKEDTSTSKETKLESKEAVSKPDPAENPGQAAPSKSSSHKKESSKPEESNAKGTEAAAAGAGPLSATATTTESGRATKPSTPAFSTHAEAAPAKSRPSRHMEAVSSKRSHKKGAAALAAVAQLAEDDATSSAQGEEEDVNMDDDEPTYCYCNGVSYGEMVACDADECEREWFHLECVGLKVAPKTNAKWYCEDCKEKMKNSGKKVNGR